MSSLLAIDPGNEMSAYVVYDFGLRLPLVWERVENERLLEVIDDMDSDALAVEMIASYGMAVGATVFETCLWIGRFIERWTSGPIERPLPRRIFRRDVKLHLCGSSRAKDPNVRQALIDRYGPGKEKAIGLKASPGPLYGMSGDCWSALAVAVTATEVAA